MKQAQLWVNDRSRKKRTKPNRKKEVQKGLVSGSAISTSTGRTPPTKSSYQNNSQLPTPSFLETISSMSKRIDLPKIKNHLSEVQDIVHQVGGVIEQINQWWPKRTEPMRNTRKSLRNPNFMDGNQPPEARSTYRAGNTR